jgi:hypothetical protein
MKIFILLQYLCDTIYNNNNNFFLIDLMKNWKIYNFWEMDQEASAIMYAQRCFKLLWIIFDLFALLGEKWAEGDLLLSNFMPIRLGCTNVGHGLVWLFFLWDDSIPSEPGLSTHCLGLASFIFFLVFSKTCLLIPKKLRVLSFF